MAKRIDLWSAVIGILTGLGMLVGGIFWLASVEAKASQAAMQAERVSHDFQDFKSEVIDRLARIEEDTKAIRHKKGE